MRIKDESVPSQGPIIVTRLPELILVVVLVVVGLLTGSFCR